MCMAHIVAECIVVCQGEFIKQNDDYIAQVVPGRDCQKWGFQAGSSESVLKYGKHKSLWDFHVRMNKKLENDKPGLSIMHKEKRMSFLIDSTCSLFDLKPKRSYQKGNYSLLQGKMIKILLFIIEQYDYMKIILFSICTSPGIYGRKLIDYVYRSILLVIVYQILKNEKPSRPRQNIISERGSIKKQQ